MPTGLRVNRGDVVLLPIAFVSGQGAKVRPAVVMQNDNLNARLNSTVVAIVTSTNVRAHTERSQLFIDIGTPDGRQTGLLHDSTVKAEHLDTVDQRDIVRRIGRFSPSLMQRLQECVEAALDFT
ncbi:MAG: type II toxin-antitoxin system PemK/MazF family toxin [Planctomycetota bacterium]|nr:type II toxin-antitoxin system PemK/MazF family toxin [Planctomycetota bacterium]